MNSFLLKCVSMKEITVSLFFWLLMAACRVFIDFLDKEGEWLYEYVWSFIWDILDNLILFFEAPIFGRSVGGSFPCSPPPDWIVTFLSISFAIREGSGYRIRWIKIPKGLWPPPPYFRKIMLQIFYDRYGCIYARRYDDQTVSNACTWFPEGGQLPSWTFPKIHPIW